MPEKDNEIAVTKSFLSLSDKVTDLNAYLGRTVTLDLSNYDRFADSTSTQFTVVGIIDDTNAPNLNVSVVFDQDLFDYFAYYPSLNDNNNINQNAILYFKNTTDVTQLVHYLAGNSYKHQTPYSDMLYGLADTAQTSKTPLLYIALVFAVFAALLLMVYISSSINNRTRDIGTLRAIGGRGADVAKIFIAEGLFIALFAAIAADILASVIIVFINNSITSGYHLSIIILYINILSIFFVLVFAGVIAALGGFLPVRRITKMKPIQAIKKIL